MKKKTWISAVVAIAAMLSSAMAQTATDADAQKQAIAKYPDLVRDGSPIHAKFLELYHQAQEFNPTLLSNPDWPLILSDKASALLAVDATLSAASASPSPTATPQAAPSAPQPAATPAKIQPGKGYQNESSTASTIGVVTDSLMLRILDCLFEGLTAVGIVAVAALAIWQDQIVTFFNPVKGEIRRSDFDGKEEGTEQMRFYSYHVTAVATKRNRPLKGCAIVFRQVNRILNEKEVKGSIYPVWRQLIWAPAERTEAKLTVPTEQQADLGQYHLQTDRFEILFYEQSGEFDRFVLRGQCAKVFIHLRADNLLEDIASVVSIDMTGLAGSKPTVSIE